MAETLRVDRSGGDALGRREIEVLRVLAEGKTSQEIGARLHIATGTVDVHRRNIMRKLSLHTVAELTQYAIRQGAADCAALVYGTDSVDHLTDAGRLHDVAVCADVGRCGKERQSTPGIAMSMTTTSGITSVVSLNASPQCICSVTRFCDHLDVGLALQHLTQGATQHCVIVSKQDPYVHCVGIAPS
jgi:DNA-binding CsgD family transcriptional regulator